MQRRQSSLKSYTASTCRKGEQLQVLALLCSLSPMNKLGPSNSESFLTGMTQKISEKQQIDPSRIVRILHVNEAGLRIMVDDDVVRELPEGQDMIVDIYESDDAQSPGSPVEIKLTY